MKGTSLDPAVEGKGKVDEKRDLIVGKFLRRVIRYTKHLLMQYGGV